MQSKVMVRSFGERATAGMLGGGGGSLMRSSFNPNLSAI